MLGGTHQGRRSLTVLCIYICAAAQKQLHHGNATVAHCKHERSLASLENEKKREVRLELEVSRRKIWRWVWSLRIWVYVTEGKKWEVQRRMWQPCFFFYDPVQQMGKTHNIRNEGKKLLISVINQVSIVAYLCRVSEGLAPSKRCDTTLDRLAVHHRETHRHRGQTTIHTQHSVLAAI